MNNPLVSVLIPLYNAENYLSKSLDSIVNQIYKNLEVIIVNDGSTDNSLTVANRYAKKYSYIKVYSQNNSGAASARNKAFGHSEGDYIQYFDADDIMHQNKISSQIEVLKEYNFDPHVVASGKWVRFNNVIENVVFCSQVTYKSYEDTLLFLKEAWGNFHYIIGQSWLISRKINEKIGKWDERITVSDDSVFFGKVAYQAKKIVYVSESKVYWRQDNIDSLSKNVSKEGMKSHLLACDNYMYIVKEDLNYPGLKYALAMQYSKFIYRAYPMYMDLVKKAEDRIKELGYNTPFPMPTKKFRLSVKIIGFYPTARLFGFKDRLVKKIRAVKDSKKWE